MARDDTPGKPGTASRQQTKHDQGVQSGSAELDAQDAGSPQQHRKYRDRPAEEGKHGDAGDEPNPGPIESGQPE